MMRLAVCSQTPLVRLLVDGLSSQDFLDVGDLKEYRDFIFSPGGVTRMVYPLLLHMRAWGMVEDVWWVSLNPTAPPKLILNGIKLRSVRIDNASLQAYGSIKELMWRLFHGTADESAPSLLELAWFEDYAYFNLYNRICAETIRELDEKEDFDLFYIHDFQQLPTGLMLSTLKPKVFRWHIPFDDRIIPPDWSPFLSKFFNAYEAVIVSCRSYLDSLVKRGYRGRAYHIYPYIDFKEYRRPSKAEIDAFCAKYYIKDNDIVALLVARLDPLKGHDMAIRALAQAVKRCPHLKMVFVGDGSFSSSAGGLGLNKAAAWREKLAGLVESLGLGDRVVFTGHLPQGELDAAYERCDIFILPSRAEGFGLVVAEAWLYGKPVIVSSAAGISEMVEDGKTGYVVNPHNYEEVAEALVRLAQNELIRAEMGESGRRAVEVLSIERGLKEEADVLKDVVEGVP
jgi:glycosyltransferase involved in cell wall biosynthesis